LISEANEEALSIT